MATRQNLPRHWTDGLGLLPRFLTARILTYFSYWTPARILLAGLDGGVYADYPTCSKLITEITPENFDEIAPALGGSAATDVTGGMNTKVHEMLGLVKKIADLEVLIFSGEPKDAVKNALLGENLGTKLFTPELWQIVGKKKIGRNITNWCMGSRHTAHY